MTVDTSKPLSSFSDAEIQELVSNLSSKLWRLDNLYYIKDKNSKIAPMRLNASQLKVLTQYKHKRKIILKSRQQGISTLYLAYNLDSCIFDDGTEAGIQSYGIKEAEKLSNRAELMWEKFPQAIKDLLGISVTSNNQSGMYFSNKSILKIGNFRGDTLQSLHVSELGKIAKKFPEKAKELKSGAFQAVSTNNIITIESTAEGKSGLFYEMWVKAAKKKALGIKLNALDFEPIFLPWYADPDCQIFDETPISKEVRLYLAKLEDELDLEFTDSQKWWYQAKYDELTVDMTQEYPSTPEEAFNQSVEGMYYKEEFKTLKIKQNLYDPNLVVYAAIDLGMSDDFVLGFFQVYEKTVTYVKDTKTYTKTIKQVRIIGEYRNSGYALSHYAEVIGKLKSTLGWVYNGTYVPHDVVQRELIAGKSRWQAMQELGFKPILVKKHSIADGIEATRQFLKEVEIDEECEIITGAIQNYRKKKDEKLGVFLDSPIHDVWSHPADMIRYMAMGMKYTPPTILYTRDIQILERKKKKNYNSRGYDI